MNIFQAFSFHTTLFADDINLCTSNSCFNVLQATANLELCKTDHWLRANTLPLNKITLPFFVFLLFTSKFLFLMLCLTFFNHIKLPQ